MEANENYAKLQVIGVTYVKTHLTNLQTYDESKCQTIKPLDMISCKNGADPIPSGIPESIKATLIISNKPCGGKCYNSSITGPNNYSGK